MYNIVNCCRWCLLCYAACGIEMNTYHWTVQSMMWSNRAKGEQKNDDDIVQHQRINLYTLSLVKVGWVKDCYDKDCTKLPSHAFKAQCCRGGGSQLPCADPYAHPRSKFGLEAATDWSVRIEASLPIFACGGALEAWGTTAAWEWIWCVAPLEAIALHEYYLANFVRFPLSNRIYYLLSPLGWISDYYLLHGNYCGQRSLFGIGLDCFDRRDMSAFVDPEVFP